MVAPVMRINQNIDVGSLLYEDASSYASIDLKEFGKRTAENLCSLYRKLYEIKKSQDVKEHGDDGAILEYDTSNMTVALGLPTTILPREKPCPIEKSKTKWEKFREEKGLPPRKKRSRLVYDEITKDWVPRWGVGSIKKIAEEADWARVEKPKHRHAGVDPFTYEKMEKKAV